MANTKLLVQAYQGGVEAAPWKAHLLPPSSRSMGVCVYPTAHLLPPMVAHPNTCHFPTPSQLSCACAVAWTVLKSFILPSASVLSYLRSLLQVIHQQIDFSSSQECLEHNFHYHDSQSCLQILAECFEIKWVVLLNVFFSSPSNPHWLLCHAGSPFSVRFLLIPSPERLLQ